MYLMAVDLRQLRYLVAVADAGSVSGAARSLYITQPALSIALRNLEREVGVPLLNRHRRGVDLTPAGVAFLARAQLALQHVDEATVIARRVGTHPTGGEITIGLLPATFSRIPRALLTAFSTERPGLRVTYRELSYIGHTRDLLTGTVDAAFLWPPLRRA